MHLSVQLSACVDNSWCSIDVEVVRIDATRINVVGHWIIVWISRRYCTNLGIWVGGMEGRRVQVVIQVGLNELHLPSGNPSRIWNTARGALNIGPTFPAVHKLGKHGCVCCRKREEGEKKSRLLPGCPQTWCRQLPWPLTQETSRQSSRHCSLAIAHASVGTACVSRNCSHQIHNRVDQCTTKNGSHAVQLQVTAASSHSRFKSQPLQVTAASKIFTRWSWQCSRRSHEHPVSPPFCTCHCAALAPGIPAGPALACCCVAIAPKRGRHPLLPHPLNKRTNCNSWFLAP